MKKIVYILGCATIFLLTACQKELSDNNITRYPDHPLNDTVWIKNIPSTAAIHDLAELLSPEIVIDSFDTNKDTTITYGDSLDIKFTAGSCVGTGGAAVSGIAKLEIFWLKKKADFIKAFKPTTAGDTIMNGRIVFFVRITKDGKELSLKTGSSIRVRLIDPNKNPHGRLDTYYGRETNPLPAYGIDTGFAWKKSDNTAGLVRPYMKPGFGVGWEFNINQLRWNGLLEDIDSLKDHSTTRISAYFPPNFTNKNTIVFAVYSNLNVVVNLKADMTSRIFSAANFLPHGRIKLLSISKIGGDFYLSTQEIVDPGLNKGLVFKLTPEKKSLNEIIQFLDTL